MFWFFFGWSRQQIRFLCKAFTILWHLSGNSLRETNPRRGWTEQIEKINSGWLYLSTYLEQLCLTLASSSALPDCCIPGSCSSARTNLHQILSRACIYFFFSFLMAQTATSDCQIQAGYFLWAEELPLQSLWWGWMWLFLPHQSTLACKGEPWGWQC